MKANADDGAVFRSVQHGGHCALRLSCDEFHFTTKKRTASKALTVVLANAEQGGFCWQQSAAARSANLNATPAPLRPGYELGLPLAAEFSN